VMANVQTFLNRAGINTVPLKLVLFLFLATSLLVIFAIQQLTSSWAIAFSCYVCLFAQLLDSLQNRAAKHTLQQQLQWPNYLDAIHSAIWAGATVQQALVDCSPHAPKTASWASYSRSLCRDNSFSARTWRSWIFTRAKGPSEPASRGECELGRNKCQAKLGNLFCKAGRFCTMANPSAARHSIRNLSRVQYRNWIVDSANWIRGFTFCFSFSALAG